MNYRTDFYSPVTLAAKLGKAQTFVSKIELGERRIDFLETLDFCAACGVSPEQFIMQLEKAAPNQKPAPRQAEKAAQNGR